MKKLAIVGALVSAMAFAADPQSQAQGQAQTGQSGAAGQKMDAAKTDPMTAMGWTPRKVTKEDKKGIEAMLKEHEQAWMKGDLEGAMAHVSFPVFMATDDSKGAIHAGPWDKAMYQKMMEPMLKNTSAMADMMKNSKMKYDYNFLSDSMAMVTCNTQMKMGKQSHSMKSAMLVVNEAGKWMIKASMEPGWGDTAMPQMNQGDMKAATPAAGSKGQK
jgi:hypothetical protein